jgi:hypothetical protein
VGVSLAQRSCDPAPIRQASSFEAGGIRARISHGICASMRWLGQEQWRLRGRQVVRGLQVACGHALAEAIQQRQAQGRCRLRVGGMVGTLTWT